MVALVGLTGAGKSTHGQPDPALLRADARARADRRDRRREAIACDRCASASRSSCRTRCCSAAPSRTTSATDGSTPATRRSSRPPGPRTPTISSTRLRQGYQTPIAEAGASLSGGERQRLSIARALLKNAPILILDEPTSSLDALSEGAVFAALRRLRSGRTTIVIAHRLSTIRDANRILVLHEGRIIAQGTHASCSTSSELYRRMCAQAERRPLARRAGDGRRADAGRVISLPPRAAGGWRDRPGAGVAFPAARFTQLLRHCTSSPSTSVRIAAPGSDTIGPRPSSSIHSVGALMLTPCVRACVGAAAFVLLLFGIPGPGPGAAGASVVSRGAIRHAEPGNALQRRYCRVSVAPGRVAAPRCTVTETKDGPQLTNLALPLPALTFGTTAVASRLGDQPLPQTFVSSPLSGDIRESADARVELLDGRRDTVDVVGRSVEDRVRRAGGVVRRSCGDGARRQPHAIPACVGRTAPAGSHGFPRRGADEHRDLDPGGNELSRIAGQ